MIDTSQRSAMKLRRLRYARNGLQDTNKQIINETAQPSLYTVLSPSVYTLIAPCPYPPIPVPLPCIPLSLPLYPLSISYSPRFFHRPFITFVFFLYRFQSCFYVPFSPYLSHHLPHHPHFPCFPHTENHPRFKFLTSPRIFSRVCASW